jgi:LmbE family N-acetylglucosaminyl deacetylase
MNIAFSNPGCDIFIPDGAEPNQAFGRVTHMGIGAHQDDLEIMALDGVLRCFGRSDAWYMGVVATNGAGSPRDGHYAAYTDEEMQKVRRAEQRKAAFVGEYSACVQLMHKSSDIKNAAVPAPAEDIAKLLRLARPRVVYTHNLADKHDTHVAVTLRVIEAIRSLPLNERPSLLYGCEVWRSLDWLRDEDKAVFDVSGRPNISPSLLGVFDSQIAGGKRYDIAALGRRKANATFLASHYVDKIDEAVYGIDMTGFIKDETLDPVSFIDGYINLFRNEILERITKFK